MRREPWEGWWRRRREEIREARGRPEETTTNPPLGSSRRSAITCSSKESTILFFFYYYYFFLSFSIGDGVERAERLLNLGLGTFGRFMGRRGKEKETIWSRERLVSGTYPKAITFSVLFKNLNKNNFFIFLIVRTIYWILGLTKMTGKLDS